MSSYAFFSVIADVKLAGMSLTADVKLDHLEPYFWRGEQTLAQAIGYELVEQAAAGQVPAQLLSLIKSVVAGYSVHAYSSLNNRLITTSGSAPLPGTKENTSTVQLIAQHQAALLANADAALEGVQFYLEQHPADFAQWHSSRYCSVYPRRYFRSVEDMREYRDAPTTRPAFRKAQGALNAILAHRVLPVIGQELHARLVQELDNADHEQVLSFIRTAMAIYLVSTDRDVLHTAECALVELRWLLQRSPDEYPEFLSSPSYVETEIGPTTTENAYVAIF